MSAEGGRHRSDVSPLRLILALVLSLALAVALVNWAVQAWAGSAHAADAASPNPAPPTTSAAPKTSLAPAAKSKAHSHAVAAKPRASSSADLTAQLPDQLDGIFGGGGDTWSLSALDVTSGTTLDLGSTGGMVTGSVVKLQILETLLRVRSSQGRSLSSGEDTLAQAMIENSDNDAALTLWTAAGGDAALEETGRLLGLADTDIDPDGWFGASATSAADQVKVLHQLVAPTFLDPDDVSYAMNLLQSVEADQRWGVPTAADANTTTANKNGWLNNDDDDELWLVNSDGIITLGGHQFLISVLSQHQPDFDTGVDRLNQAMSLVAAALKS